MLLLTASIELPVKFSQSAYGWTNLVGIKQMKYKKHLSSLHFQFTKLDQAANAISLLVNNIET